VSRRTDERSESPPVAAKVAGGGDENQTRASRFHSVSLAVLICYWLAMFAGTHWPHLSLGRFPTNFDKVLHFSANCGLAFLMAVWLSTRRDVRLPQLGWIFAVVFVYAILDELTQPPFGRDCEFFDAVADWIGGLAGLGVFLAVRSALRRVLR
jgi:VanZ like family